MADNPEPDPDQATLAARYEAMLRAEKTELDIRSESARDDRSPVQLDQQSVGRVSRGDSLQVQAMAQAAEGRRQLRKQRLAGAFQRLEAGEFGYCTECGEFIGLKRLDIDPTAFRCIACEG
jgi:DnaK suppressor protein